MELTQKNFEDRLETLRKIINDEGSNEYNNLKNNLKEKGVECAIVMPIIEIVFDFDPLFDIQFEKSSEEKHGQRFDFLLDNSFLIEVKPISAKLDNHDEQIRSYIRKNNNINYGIITNGIEYQVWMQKKFIERVANKDLSKHFPNKNVEVIKVFEISMTDISVEDFISIMEIFGKKSYKNTFEAMARNVSRIMIGGRGSYSILHEDRNINRVIIDNIKSFVGIKRGYYYGKYEGGTRLVYDDSGIRISVIVKSDGYLEVDYKGCNVYDYKSAIASGAKRIFDLMDVWGRGENYKYKTPIDIIRDIRDIQKVHNKDNYLRKFKLKR